MPSLEVDALQNPERPGSASGFACAECHRALWELQDGDLIRYRCRVGHALTADTLVAEQGESLETALWTALRALEERSALARRLAARSREVGNAQLAARYEERVHEGDQSALLIRQMLLSGDGMAREERVLSPAALASTDDGAAS